MTDSPLIAGSLLLTGASGFVGKSVLSSLVAAKRWRIVCASRRASSRDVEHVPFDLSTSFDLQSSLEGIGCVVHMAARVHVMNETIADPLGAFRAINFDATLELARQAARAGVRRFIFLSSIKVNGEQTAPRQPFTVQDRPQPQDPYGISKHEAEQGLRALAAETGMEVVVIRPVLVYGPGVKANFHSMMSWLSKGIPLPLGAIANKRSLVALDNLVDLIVTCVDHPAAANQTFLVSDDEDVSTSELLRRMAYALGKPARLLPVPASLLQVGATLLGKRDVARRLCGSLQADISHTKARLNWAPPVSLDQALMRTAQEFLEHPSL